MNPKTHIKSQMRKLLDGVKDFKKLNKNGVSNTSFSFIKLNSFLKGILSSQEYEIDFLDELMKTKTMSQGTLDIIWNRLEALKLSCQDLRRVLK